MQTNHSPPRGLLLACDKPHDMARLQQLLQPLDLPLLPAQDSDRLEQQLTQGPPELTLLDMRDGAQAAALIRRHSDAPLLQILPAGQAPLRQASDFLHKPVQAAELLLRVRGQLQLQRLRRQLAEQRQAADSANAHILEAVAEGIYGVDGEGRILFANPAAERLTGFSRQQLIGRNAFDLHLRGRDGERIARPEDTALWITLRTGQTQHSEDERFLRADGSEFAVAYTSSPTREAGRQSGAVIAFRDITGYLQQRQALRDALAEVARLKDRLQAENSYLQTQLAQEGRFGDIIGDSPALRAVLMQIRQVAPTDSTVLILGESGTGKEALARAIHDNSNRAERALIKVNCGAISPNLIESELFGHEKGAFTGALKQHAGHFELADGGTIFLDEVGELPLEAQVKLLRVLQEKEFSRVGSEQSIRVDVRIVAATNQNLARLVEQGQFRMDLYYRLNVFPLQIPPLRERIRDIPLLAAKFIADQSRRLGRSFTPLEQADIELLMGYPWPGNIRELQNVIERAAILATGPKLSLGTLLGNMPPLTEGSTAAEQATGQASADDGPPPTLTLAEAEARHIRQTLARTNWMIAGRGGAAELLDLPPSTLRSRMKKLGIRRPDN